MLWWYWSTGVTLLLHFHDVECLISDFATFRTSRVLSPTSCRVELASVVQLQFHHHSTQSYPATQNWRCSTWWPLRPIVRRRIWRCVAGITVSRRNCACGRSCAGACVGTEHAHARAPVEVVTASPCWSLRWVATACARSVTWCT